MNKVFLYSEGLVFDRVRSSSFKSGGGVRGAIRRFTSAASLRLRSALLRFRLDGGRRVGVTLTLPWVVLDWSSCMDDFKDVMHRFRVAWLRRFPSCGSIYRVELQRRGAPHVHMISWHEYPFDPSLTDSYFRLWFDSLHGLRGGSMSDFARHGVVVDLDINEIGAIRYLCDHASKSKQAQLGYKGKQWGILGKANFRDCSGFPFELSDREFALLRRWVSRLLRFRVKADCVFGSRLSRRCYNRKIFYLSDSSVTRLFNLFPGIR